MTYWMKTRWPALRDRAHEPNDIWVDVGKEDAAKEMRPGDSVFIYEIKNGKPRKDGLKYRLGRMGIVALVEVDDVDLHEGFEQVRVDYVYLKPHKNFISYKLIARTRPVDTSRFCCNEDLCDCFGYKRGFHFMGFGKNGLKKLAEKEVKCIQNHFR